MTTSSAAAPAGTGSADTLLTHSLVVTMDDGRRVISDGAVAIRGNQIVAVGKTAEVTAQLARRQRRRRIPVRHHAGPDQHPHPHHRRTAHQGLCPRRHPVHRERLRVAHPDPHALHRGGREDLGAARVAGDAQVRHHQLPRGGHHPVHGPGRRGPRPRSASGPGSDRWAWDLVPHYEALRMSTDQAIAADDRRRRPVRIGGGRSGAGLADRHRPHLLQRRAVAGGEGAVRRARHRLQLPHVAGRAWTRSGSSQTYGKRPMAHLEDIGVLGDNAIATHVVHVDDEEIEILARTGTSVSHCPTTALKVSYGVTQIGKLPEMVAARRQRRDRHRRQQRLELPRPDARDLPGGRAVQGRPARRERCSRPRTPSRWPPVAERAGCCARTSSARSRSARRPTWCCTTRNRPEWRPLHNVANQLVWSADGRGVHSVYVDGRLVVDDYRCTTRRRGRPAAARPDRRRGDPGPVRPSRPRQVADRLA